jgi:hypothetical protein
MLYKNTGQKAASMENRNSQFIGWEAKKQGIVEKRKECHYYILLHKVSLNKSITINLFQFSHKLEISDI